MVPIWDRSATTCARVMVQGWTDFNLSSARSLDRDKQCFANSLFTVNILKTDSRKWDSCSIKLINDGGNINKNANTILGCSESHIIAYYYRPQGKVIFSQASVILSTRGDVSAPVHARFTLQTDNLPWADTPLGSHPPWADTPQTDTPS